MNKFEEKLILDQLETSRQKKISFWGASTFLFEFLSKNNLNDYNIIGIIDNNPKLNNANLLSYKIHQPQYLKEEPDIIIFTIKNNFFKIYELIKKDVKKFFPNANLLPNIFAKTNLEKYVSNKIFIVDEHDNKMQVSYIPGLTVHWHGINATIEIMANPMPKFKDCIFCCGNNTQIIIGSTPYELNNMEVSLQKDFSKLIIGNHFSVNGCKFWLTGEKNQTIEIGDDCMFSHGIIIRSSDFHSVYNNTDKKVINFSKDIKIQNHVWICQNVTLLKGTTIPNNCIVGANSLVNKSFSTENAIISGHPAKVRKTDINWDRSIPTDFNNDNL